MKLMDFTSFALKNLFSKPATSNYPFEPATYPERSRGHIEIDIDDCIMCGMCQRKCPSGAITVDRATKTWSIERMGCVQCENCVAGCPKKCLHIKPGYTAPSTAKTVDSYSQPVTEAPTAATTGSDEKPALTSGKITNDISTCILCGLCARQCPADCITIDRDAKTWSINRDDCMQCGACIDACKKFHSLSYAEDDGETGVVTFDKNNAPAPAPKAEAPAATDAPALTSGKIANDMEKCILCGLCARQCPAECITVDRDAKTWTINRDECMQCGACIDACKKFNALCFVEDDGEAGEVTFSKDGAAAPAKPAQKPAPAPKKEEAKDEVKIEGKLTTQKPNPELSYGKIANDIDTCILCGLCARACPLDLITVDRKDAKTWSIDRDSCLQCGCCVDACAKLHCLGYADDDAEYGVVTYKKEA